MRDYSSIGPCGPIFRVHFILQGAPRLHVPDGRRRRGGSDQEDLRGRGVFSVGEVLEAVGAAAVVELQPPDPNLEFAERVAHGLLAGGAGLQRPGAAGRRWGIHAAAEPPHARIEARVHPLLQVVLAAGGGGHLGRDREAATASTTRRCGRAFLPTADICLQRAQESTCDCARLVSIRPCAVPGPSPIYSFRAAAASAEALGQGSAREDLGHH